jgi:hypothetical protein
VLPTPGVRGWMDVLLACFFFLGSGSRDGCIALAVLPDLVSPGAACSHPFQLKIKNDMKGGKLRIAFPSTTWSPDLLNVAGFEHLNPASNTGTGLTLSSNDIGKEGERV